MVKLDKDRSHRDTHLHLDHIWEYQQDKLNRFHLDQFSHFSKKVCRHLCKDLLNPEGSFYKFLIHQFSHFSKGGDQELVENR